MATATTAERRNAEMTTVERETQRPLQFRAQRPQRLLQRSLRLQAQSTIEYAVFATVVAAALLGMQLYVRRAIQANLKTLEARINAEAITP